MIKPGTNWVHPAEPVSAWMQVPATDSGLLVFKQLDIALG